MERDRGKRPREKKVKTWGRRAEYFTGKGGVLATERDRRRVQQMEEAPSRAGYEA